MLVQVAPEIQRAAYGGPRVLETLAFWRRVQAEVTPLEAALAAEAAAEESDAEAALALALEAAAALATRPCAHTGCTTVVGISEAAAKRGKQCAGCEAVRYCGRACQTAAWRGHRAACLELKARRAAGPPGS